MQVCLFCGGDGSEPGHRQRCDGRQGRVEASIDESMARGPVILDLVEARRRRDVGIDAATAHARALFIEAAYHALLRVLVERAEFIIDDVWAAMGPDAPDTHERRAIAAVILRALREKRIEPTGVYRQSAQLRGHATPRQVWRRAG